MQLAVKTIHLRGRFKAKQGTGWALACRLLRVNGTAFALQLSMVAITANLFYAPAFFLQHFVAYLETDPERKNPGWGRIYCIGLFSVNAMNYLCADEDAVRFDQLKVALENVGMSKRRIAQIYQLLAPSSISTTSNSSLTTTATPTPPSFGVPTSRTSGRRSFVQSQAHHRSRRECSLIFFPFSLFLSLSFSCSLVWACVRCFVVRACVRAFTCSHFCSCDCSFVPPHNPLPAFNLHSFMLSF